MHNNYAGEALRRMFPDAPDGAWGLEQGESTGWDVYVTRWNFQCEMPTQVEINTICVQIISEAKIAEIRAAHDAFTGARAPEYGVTSRDTWATQEKTARDLHDGVITEEQAAPLLLLVAGRASTGGAALTATEQAGRIIRNADAWRALGLWTEGQRNGYCDQVDAVMATVSDDALAALSDDAARMERLDQARNALEAILPAFSEPPV